MNKRILAKLKKFPSARLPIASLAIVGILLGTHPSVSSSNPVHQVYQAANKQVAYRNQPGRFQVVYNPVKNQAFKELETIFIKSKAFENVAASLNSFLNLPRDIPIVLSECEEENAFYDEESHSITICYELISNLAEFSKHQAVSEEDLIKSTIGGTLFVFFHELGHALIHELNLPVVGKEEDAADQIAVVLMTTGVNYLAETSTLVVATWSKDNAEQTDLKKLPYWDQHSLNMQRYYNIICWLYGSDPSRYAALIKVAGLPGQRAQSCPGEYRQAKTSWFRLLEPYTQSDQRVSPPRSKTPTPLW